MTWLAILNLLKRFWPAIPIAGLSLALFAVTMQRNDARADAQSARNALAATEANVRAATAQAHADDLANVRRVEDEQTAINERISDDFQDRLAELRGAFAERVRVATETAASRSAGAHLPGVSDASGKPDESACKAQFPDRDALIASEQAEQLIALQAWVKAQMQVKVN